MSSEEEKQPLQCTLDQSVGAQAPKQETHGDAGYDVCSVEDYNLQPGERHDFSTGVRVSCPEDTVLLVKPRSGLALKHGIDVMAGVIDWNYRGHLKVVLINHSNTAFQVKKFNRIAQLVPLKLNHNTCPSFQVVNRLAATSRGSNGFGSSGV